MPQSEINMTGARPFIQPVLMALLIAAVVWVANTTNSNDKSLGIIAVKLEHLVAEMSGIKDVVETRPSEERFNILMSRVGDLDSELIRMHQKINAFIASGMVGGLKK